MCFLTFFLSIICLSFQACHILMLGFWIKEKKSYIHNTFWQICTITDNLEGWPEGSGKEAQEEEDVCILLADSHCCTLETNKM